MPYVGKIFNNTRFYTLLLLKNVFFLFLYENFVYPYVYDYYNNLLLYKYIRFQKNDIETQSLKVDGIMKDKSHVCRHHHRFVLNLITGLAIVVVAYCLEN